MRFYVIRHGESVGNLNKICLGHTDLGLTDKGREQAVITANALCDVDFLCIYSSDLVRAVETSLPNATLRGGDESCIMKRRDLRELYFGDWENSAVEDLKNNYGDMFPVGWRQHFGTFTPPNGESVPALADRMCAAFAAIADECQSLLSGRYESDNKTLANVKLLCKDGVKNTLDCDEQNVLVVSHAASIRAFWGKISGYAAEDVCAAVPFPTNASYSIFDYDIKTGKFTPVSYSVDEHLADLKTALM